MLTSKFKRVYSLAMLTVVTHCSISAWGLGAVVRVVQRIPRPLFPPPYFLTSIISSSLYFQLANQTLPIVLRHRDCMSCALCEYHGQTRSNLQLRPKMFVWCSWLSRLSNTQTVLGSSPSTNTPLESVVYGYHSGLPSLRTGFESRHFHFYLFGAH